MSAPLAGIRMLRQFVTGPVERCDFCRVRLPDRHAHLVEPTSLRLFCTCSQCSDDMCAEGSGYRRVRPRQKVLPGFELADADWAMMQIPIDVAFLFRPDGDAAPVALFPGPAGTTRSQLNPELWSDLTARYAVLAELEPGAEALLVNRSKGRRDHYLVSTDHCYALAGLLRTRWRGLTGGEEAWSAIDGYFAELNAMARGSPASHA